ncbi:MAG: response regulator [Treponema sp.]|jgi:two-component system chemotaxis response regulator CheY|nr:response regulator [Treponema sp.]
MKLLIVDDSTMIRKMIERSLTEKNFTLAGSVADGEEALSIFKETLPDLVTMDIAMPKMDGITALEEMLKIKSDAKILMITSQTDTASATEALGKGAVGYLGKPFTAAQIIEKVNEVLGL